ncbi:GNAT family N-acetyltransferase [Amaricoccus solimangrovi]|uniref:GNAT family N-acetyltransferase n=1 Tax=Amaricoccus solimangrovi TaxID=2589815 RepID=A0A501WM60_9RHOB|nr:GNAT family N-acetyltransferase [Amaricoccus solimangrovi]TPE49922.1 GNAT family N-acetyltransferase [Amaricoccus solimangrovi]
MTPEALAALHLRCFEDTPPPWSAGEFSLLLALPGARLVTRAGGFALAQTAGPEAELLTIAVDPELRRRGTGRALLETLAEGLAAEGVEEIFLEVAVTNLPARALYRAAGYVERGLRRGYYRRRNAPAVDALVLARAAR